MDQYTQNQMQDWLLKILYKSPKTVLLITHYIEEAAYLADRFLILRDQKIVADIANPLPHPRSQNMKFESLFNQISKEILQKMLY